MVFKYLLQTSVRKFHSDLIIAELDGEIGCVWKGKKLLAI